MHSNGTPEASEQSAAMLQTQTENGTGNKRLHHKQKYVAFPRLAYAWSHATVGPVFFFFLAAYMLQTSLVMTYIDEELNNNCTNHSVSVKIDHINDNSDFAANDSELYAHNSLTTHHRLRRSDVKHNSDHPEQESHDSSCHVEYEKQLSYWNLVLLLIYAGPSLILAPLLGSWTDGLHRVIPMYICALGMTISSMCIAVAILISSSTSTVVFCTLPSGFTGGAVLFTIAMYSYEAEKNNNFEIFESYLTLQMIYVAAKTVVQLLVYLAKIYSSMSVLLWGPLVFSLIACFGLIHRRIKDDRPVRFRFCHFTFIHLSKDFIHMIKARLWALHILLFICAFVFYFAYVGETAEIMHILNHNEPWEIASFSIYGAAQGVSEGIGLIVTLYFWKTVVHKKIIDKELLPHFSVFILGILGYASDMATKIIVSITPTHSIQYWEPLIGVISELAIVVIRYFAVLLVDKADVGKVLSLVGMAQILSTVPGAISAKAIHGATQWWSNFVYLFLALIQLIPIALILIIMKFANLPDIDLHPEEDEDDEKEKKKEKLEDEINV